MAAEKPVSAGELLNNKGTLIGCALFSFQQFSGINAIVYFSSAVFAQACPCSGPSRAGYQGVSSDSLDSLRLSNKTGGKPCRWRLRR